MNDTTSTFDLSVVALRDINSALHAEGIDGQYVIMPTLAQSEFSDLDLLLWFDGSEPQTVDAVGVAALGVAEPAKS